MIGTIRRAVAIAAVSLGVFAAPAAAYEWTDGGVQFNGPAHTVGTLTAVLVANGAQSTCDVYATASLTNLGVSPLSVADGEVTGVTVSNCSTTIPNCSPTTAFAGFTWGIETLGDDVATIGIDYTDVYSGGACALNGTSIRTTGSVTGDHVPATNTVEFVGATGLSGPYGPVALNGVLEIVADDGFGSPDWGRPVELT